MYVRVITCFLQRCALTLARCVQILASASRDTTVRLWNIFGSNVPGSSNPVPAMGTGDEGSILVGLLAGGTVGGHVEGVTALVSPAVQSALPCITQNEPLTLITLSHRTSIPNFLSSSPAGSVCVSRPHYPISHTYKG